jgi:hypothetical protein
MMQGGTERNAACLRDAIRRHCHAQLISQARLTVDLGALSCCGQARFSSVIGALPISLARLISQARLISRAPLTVASGALSYVDSGALSCVDPGSPVLRRPWEPWMRT